MKLSHMHVSLRDLDGGVSWFKQVLGLAPILHNAQMAVFRFDDVDLVLHPDWGDGDTSMTLALQSENCERDYSKAIERGARERTKPRDKGDVIGADVHGPGKLVIEFEQKK